ncbi:hypothetical protein FB446DRAFT_785497 [Lentinula raphanica]|nr:hypothetical protein FB446DRAFT_785497 [Lentinula raphanica]
MPLDNNSNNLSDTIQQLCEKAFHSDSKLSLEHLGPLLCCCERAECSNYRTWQAQKSQLEEKLHLSAELGQALLKRHEAHNPRYQSGSNDTSISESSASEETHTLKKDAEDRLEDPDDYISQLLQERDTLAGELEQTVTSKEAIELSLATAEQELHEAHTEISKLSVLRAKYETLQSRLLATEIERDDMRLERDIQAVKANVAEQKLTKSTAKIATLQSELHQIKGELKEKDRVQAKSTETTIRSTKSRLRTLQTALSQIPVPENAGYTEMLVSVSRHEEELRQENTELKSLLSETRDNLRTLQQEFEEQQVSLPTKELSATDEDQRVHENFPLGMEEKVIDIDVATQ